MNTQTGQEMPVEFKVEDRNHSKLYDERYRRPGSCEYVLHMTRTRHLLYDRDKIWVAMIEAKEENDDNPLRKDVTFIRTNEQEPIPAWLHERWFDRYPNADCRLRRHPRQESSP